MNRKRRVAFICQKNTGRSQIAEALGKWYGKDVMDSYSAGTEPGDKLSPDAVEAMLEVYDVDMTHSQFPKGLHDIPEVDILISLAGEDLSEADVAYYEDWTPEFSGGEDFYDTIAHLEEKIKYLVDLIIRGRYPIDEELFEEEVEAEETEEEAKEEPVEIGYNVEKLSQEY